MAVDVVLDTNVIVSALISRRGASFQLVRLAGLNRFEMHLSVPLVLEYEDTAKRLSGAEIGLTPREIDDVIDYLCRVGHSHRIYYLWRPFLTDPRDDMVLELAVRAQCDHIVTHNISDFQGIEPFGLTAIRPQALLEMVGGDE